MLFKIKAFEVGIGADAEETPLIEGMVEPLVV